MKNLLSFITIAVFTIHLGAAQPVMKKKPIRIIASADQIFMNAEWSPSGDFIAFTSKGHNGLFIADEKGRKIRKISEDKGAGFQFSWSQDGASILSRPLVVDNGKRYHQVALYSVKEGTKQVLANNSRTIKSMPVWVDGDANVAFASANGLTRVHTGKASLKGKTDSKLTLLKGNVVVNANDLSITNPEFEGRYVFNLKQSPDGKKIVFQVNGLGLYLINADGSGLKHLGYAEQAAWMPDSKYILAAKVQDDGEVLTKGSIEAIDVITGNTSVLMAEDDIIALNPSVSPDGSRVLIDNVKDGAIYVFEL